jgi:hypothetical protein
MRIAREAIWKWLAVALLLAAGGTASAARARFHFVPTDSCGNVTLVPFAVGAPGERLSVFGRQPYCSMPRPTCTVTFRHPVSGCLLRVPLALPPDTPTIQHRSDRVNYNYGSYAVEVHFLPDGSLDVTYSNGLLRDI